jgi:hypothetical protein
MKKTILLSISLSLFLFSCKKDKNEVPTPSNPNEEELITTVGLAFDNGSIQDTFFFRDIDGPGGMQPSKFDTIRLQSNTTYTMSVLLLDENKNPADTISNEVLNEAEEHQFFFTSIGSYNITTNYQDADANGVPIGLNNEVITGGSFSDKTNKYKVVLKHQPSLKPTSGNGDSSLGESDIEIEFPILFHSIVK